MTRACSCNTHCANTCSAQHCPPYIECGCWCHQRVSGTSGASEQADPPPSVSPHAAPEVSESSTPNAGARS